MKRLSRRVKRHFNMPNRRVAIKSHRAWYWQVVAALILVALGYALAFWQLTMVGHVLNPSIVMKPASQPALKNQELLAKVVFAERQLQVQKAAQENLASELATVQEESIKLKESLAFYQSILEEIPGGDQVRLSQLKVEKGKQPGQYNYGLVLSQQGTHSKSVQGSIQLILHGSKSGGQQQVALPLKSQTKVNFRYYQRLDGSFNVPEDMNAEAIEIGFVASGTKQPAVSQRIDLPA